MSSILSGARKYGLGLVLAHQDLDQLARRDAELANSVISNPSIRVCFRCGDKDAAKLADGFSYFDSTDLQNLGVGQAIARVGLKDHDFNFTFTRFTKPDYKTGSDKQKTIIDYCRSTYAIHLSEVDENLREILQKQPVYNKAEKQKTKPKSEIEQYIIEPDIPIETSEPKVNLRVEAQQKVGAFGSRCFQNLKHPVLGYVKGAGFGNVDYVDTGMQGQALHPDYKQYDIVIFSNIEFDEGRHNSIRSNPAYKLAYEVKTGNAWGEIYVTADLPIINSE